MEHLFVNSLFSTKIWSCFCWHSSQIGLLNLPLSDRITSWHNDGVTARGVKLWKLLPHAIIWSVWVERNQRVFNEEEKIPEQIISQIKEAVWIWNLGKDLLRNMRLDTVITDRDNVVHLQSS